MNKIVILMLTILLVFTTVACDDKETATTTPAPVAETTATEQEFTRDDLAAYDGKDGNKAFVAVDGIVYDLTNSQAWRDGQHNGFEAGQDLTEEIKNDSPHGISNIDGIEVVGKLVD